MSTIYQHYGTLRLSERCKISAKCCKKNKQKKNNSQTTSRGGQVDFQHTADNRLPKLCLGKSPWKTTTFEWEDVSDASNWHEGRHGRGVIVPLQTVHGRVPTWQSQTAVKQKHPLRSETPSASIFVLQLWYNWSYFSNNTSRSHPLPSCFHKKPDGSRRSPTGSSVIRVGGKKNTFTRQGWGWGQTRGKKTRRHRRRPTCLRRLFTQELSKSSRWLHKHTESQIQRDHF